MTFLHIAVSLPRKRVVRLTDRPDMTLDVYRGRKTTNPIQQQTFLVVKESKFSVLGQIGLGKQYELRSSLIKVPIFQTNQTIMVIIYVPIL